MTERRITYREAVERLGKPYEVKTPNATLYRETKRSALQTAELQAKAHGIRLIIELDPITEEPLF